MQGTPPISGCRDIERAVQSWRAVMVSCDEAAQRRTVFFSRIRSPCFAERLIRMD
jgi:hypothetical protein